MNNNHQPPQPPQPPLAPPPPLEDFYHLLGVGLGPFNLSLAALTDPIKNLKTIFFEKKEHFSWHEGMMIEGTSLQVPFFADLVTMADPTNPFSFLNYLHQHQRLFHFYFLEKFHIARSEYNHYAQWVAQQLSACQFSTEIEEIKWDEQKENFIVCTNKKKQLIQAKNIVLGVGSVPYLPEKLKNIASDFPQQIFHSAHFLSHLESITRISTITANQKKKLVVVGSGQSAAECFLHLLRTCSLEDFHLTWMTRAAGFFPMEYSKLGLEYFSPDYTQFFYQLPHEQKNKILKKQDLLYKGISFQTIADIYDTLYEKTIGGRKIDVQLLPMREVLSIEKNNSSFQLQLKHTQTAQESFVEADAVILGTGYHTPFPSALTALKNDLCFDENNQFLINENYTLQTDKKISGKIFVQNAEKHTHGVGAPDLGLGCYRNSVIIKELTGKDYYPGYTNHVFQQFN